MDNIEVKFESINLEKAIDIMLLGKNSRPLRIATAHLIKGLYESKTMTNLLFTEMLKKLANLQQSGVNSIEFFAVFSYMCKNELSTKER